MTQFKEGDTLICTQEYTCGHMTYIPGNSYKVANDNGIIFIYHSNNDGVVVNRAHSLNSSIFKFFKHINSFTINTEQDYYKWLSARLL